MITGSEYTFLSSLQGSANQIHSEIPLTPTRMDMIKKKKKVRNKALAKMWGRWDAGNGRWCYRFGKSMVVSQKAKQFPFRPAVPLWGPPSCGQRVQCLSYKWKWGDWRWHCDSAWGSYWPSQRRITEPWQCPLIQIPKGRKPWDDDRQLYTPKLETRIH